MNSNDLNLTKEAYLFQCDLFNEKIKLVTMKNNFNHCKKVTAAIELRTVKLALEREEHDLVLIKVQLIIIPSELFILKSKLIIINIKYLIPKLDKSLTLTTIKY